MHGLHNYKKTSQPHSIILEFTDADLETEVMESIQHDPEIPLADKESIAIKVKNGVVWLKGKVRNLNSKVRALTIAFWCDGVNDVKDSIEVSS